MTPEGRIQAVILEWAKYAPGVELWRNRSAESSKGKRKLGDRAGSADLEGWVETTLIDGVTVYCFLAVEVKAGANDLSDDQRKWRERVDKGGCWITAYSLQDAIDGVAEWRRRYNPQFGI